MFGDPDKITMCPDTWVLLKIGSMVFATVRVSPKVNRHGWKGLDTTQLAGFIDVSIAAIITANFDSHSERQALNLAAVDRQHGATGCKAGNDVGATGN